MEILNATLYFILATNKIIWYDVSQMQRMALFLIDKRLSRETGPGERRTGSKGQLGRRQRTAGIRRPTARTISRTHRRKNETHNE